MSVEIPLDELTRIVDDLRVGRAALLPTQHAALQRLERILADAGGAVSQPRTPWGSWSSQPK